MLNCVKFTLQTSKMVFLTVSKLSSESTAREFISLSSLFMSRRNFVLHSVIHIVTTVNMTSAWLYNTIQYDTIKNLQSTTCKQLLATPMTQLHSTLLGNSFCVSWNKCHLCSWYTSQMCFSTMRTMVKFLTSLWHMPLHNGNVLWLGTTAFHGHRIRDKARGSAHLCKIFMFPLKILHIKFCW